MRGKTVSIVAHSFDCLPGHEQISARGEAGSVRVAIQRAVLSIFQDRRLRHKQINDFKMTVVVIADRRLSDGR